MVWLIKKTVALGLELASAHVNSSSEKTLFFRPMMNVGNQIRGIA